MCYQVWHSKSPMSDPFLGGLCGTVASIEAANREAIVSQGCLSRRTGESNTLHSADARACTNESANAHALSIYARKRP